MQKEQFKEWEANPVTKEVMGVIRQAQNQYIMDLASGQTLGDSTETAKFVGIIEGLNFLLNIQYEDAAEESE